MINLFKYIKESLFDDEEEQLSRMDGAVMIEQIKKEDSMFRQEYQCYDTNPRFGSHMMQNASWERGVLKIPTRHINHISVKGEVHPLSFYIPNTKELICCNYEDKTRGEISPKTLCDKVTCAYFFSYITNNVKDMHIVIDPAYIRKELQVSSTNRPDVVFSGFYSPVIENTKIEFIDPIPGGNLGKHIAFHEFPTFKNVESNANYISVYDPMAFDHDDLDKIFNIFEWPLKATIKDFKKSEEVEMTIKGLKKAKAIANNPKRYFPITQVFKLKPNAKLSDIIDISKMKNLQRFAYKDNSISLIFDKDPIKSMCNCEPEPLKIETHQKTKDGYYVYLECEK